MRRGFRLGILYILGFSVLLLLLAGVSWVGNLQATDGLQTGRGVLTLGIVLLASIGLGFYILLNIRDWRLMRTYARTGRMPGTDMTQGNL